MFYTKAYLNELLSEPVKDINWFKDGVIPKMKGFEFRYKTNKNNGTDHVGFRSERLSGHIDFWSSGMLEVYILDNETNRLSLSSIKNLRAVLFISDESNCEKSRVKLKPNSLKCSTGIENAKSILFLNSINF